MHHEMGRLGGQAGFVDVETGVKVRGASFVHEVGEVLEQAREKWVGVKVWMGVLVRKVK